MTQENFETEEEWEDDDEFDFPYDEEEILDSMFPYRHEDGMSNLDMYIATFGEDSL